MIGILKKWQERRKAARSIPQDVYELIASINSRYLTLDLESGKFKDLTEREKLQTMVKYINIDDDLFRLHSRSMICAIMVVRQARSDGTIMPLGLGCGLTVCFDHSGLYIYDYNDLTGEYRNIPIASAYTLECMGIKLTAEKLRGAIVNYTDKKQYIDHVADFDKTFSENRAA